MKRWYKTLSAFVLVGLLSLAVAGQVAWAQADGGDPGNRPGRPGQQQGDGQRPSDPLHDIIDHDAIKSVVAETLGLTVDELDAAHEAGTTLAELAEVQGITIADVQAAAKAAAVAQINQAVTDGAITQEQADALMEQITNSDFPLGGRGHGDKPGRPDDALRGIIDPAAIRGVVAETLGLTVEELEAAREAGTTLEELAAAQGIPLEDLQAAVKAAAIAQVNQAVTDGIITQEEADALIERINNRDFPLNDPKDGHGRGPGHGHPDNPLRDLIDHDAIKSVVAGTLGLTVEALDAAREAGTTLEALAEAQGVAIEDVQAAAKAAMIAQINQAVTDGTITQEEADTLIEHITNSDFPLGGRGPHHGHDADDTGDEGGSDDADTDTTEDGGNAAAQGDTVTVAKLFLPLVTR